jgi:hypothetical protein
MLDVKKLKALQGGNLPYEER